MYPDQHLFCFFFPLSIFPVKMSPYLVFSYTLKRPQELISRISSLLNTWPAGQGAQF